MKFDNRENECVILPDGRTVWLSRSVAVVACICAMDYIDNQMKFLMVKRGEGAADNHGSWCLPCGYVDWDESGTEAVCREVYEETGVNLGDVMINAKWCSPTLKQPFFVNTDPKENRQNISLSYGLFFGDSRLPVTNIIDEKEVAEVSWQSCNWIETNKHNICFNHYDRIRMYVNILEER